MRRASAVLLSALLLLAMDAASVSAEDNTAVAVNTKDGSSVFKLSFSVKKTMDTDVDAANAAVAYASCTDCKTVAAAIQVVLVMNDADAVAPTNVALAINYECSECDTLAAAYQFVYGDGEPVEFTEEGKRRLHDIKKRFHDLKHRDDLTIEELAQAIAALASEVATVVDEEVVAKNPDAPQETDHTESTSTTTAETGDDTTGTTSTTTPTATPTPTSSSAEPVTTTMSVPDPGSDTTGTETDP